MIPRGEVLREDYLAALEAELLTLRAAPAECALLVQDAAARLMMEGARPLRSTVTAQAEEVERAQALTRQADERIAAVRAVAEVIAQDKRPGIASLGRHLLRILDGVGHAS